MSLSLNFALGWKKNLLTCCRISCLRGRSRRFAPKPLPVPDSFRGALPERRSWFLSRKQESERRGDSDSSQARQNQAITLKMINNFIYTIPEVGRDSGGLLLQPCVSFYSKTPSFWKNGCVTFSWKSPVSEHWLIVIIVRRFLNFR